MSKTIYKSKAIQAIIWILAAILLVSLWPLRLPKEKVTSSISGADMIMSNPVDDVYKLRQTFLAQYDHMDHICFYLGEGSTEGSFHVRIRDPKSQLLCDELVEVSADQIPGYVTAEIDVDMKVNETYRLTIQGGNEYYEPNGSFCFGYEGVSSLEHPWVGILYYNDEQIDGVSLTADYTYTVPLRKLSTLLYAGIIFLLAVLLHMLTALVYRKREDGLVTVGRVVQVVLNPVLFVLTAGALLAIFQGRISRHLLDNSVYTISILLLAGMLYYGINHNRQGVTSILTAEYLSEHAADLFQTICFAGAIAACCEYMSGLYDIHHAIAERKEMLWFAFAILAMFRLGELVNLWNVVYLVIAGVCGYRYYVTNLTEDMDADHRLVLKYTVWIAILLGLILIRTLIALCRRELARPAIPFAGMQLLFFALLIVFRNGRWWTVAMTVSFTLLYLTYGMWQHKERFLTNVARGVALQFLYATGYCLLHRPYSSYGNTRYTHIFHTVTITAAYLTMVECVALVMLLHKLTISRRLRDIYKELVFFGVVSAYMIFTMARTAYAAVAVVSCFALFVIQKERGKAYLTGVIKNLGMMILSVAVLLPVTFTLQRNIPALVSEPVLYEIEYSMNYMDDVKRGRHISSPNYMRVGRFIDVFCEKIFGIPEGTFDLYGEIEEYKKTHSAQDLVASISYAPDILVADGEEAEEEERSDYTNGRLDIFRSYIEQLNMTGHEEMGAILKNGEIATHAHDIYLQVAYDHGIPVGIVFVLVGLAILIKSIIFYFRRKEEDPFAALPMVIVLAVAVAGVVEWVYHVSNPCGFLLMTVITPLFFFCGGKEQKVEL